VSDHEAFLSALGERPNDATTRLVYADWLEEHGDDRRARYLRAELELAGLSEQAPEYAGREAELLALRGTIDAGWLARAGMRYDVCLLGYGPAKKIATIKALRELTGSGLLEAKVRSEVLPSIVRHAVPRPAAEQARQALAPNASVSLTVAGPTVAYQLHLPSGWEGRPYTNHLEELRAATGCAIPDPGPWPSAVLRAYDTEEAAEADRQRWAHLAQLVLVVRPGPTNQPLANSLPPR
jgi:uncharacterized protein (TIGR02996 family)